jgi:hypothetical protein
MKRLSVHLLICFSICAHTGTGPLIVHEWGTFTSLQDETGRAIGGINSDDEPVPKFVHDLDRLLILRPDPLPPICYQGAPRCHPDVTMRLETPVIYFHLPVEVAKPLAVDVKVAWPGGWLTQFYPDAQAETPGAFGALDDKTTSRLTWQNLTVGGDASGPITTEHVWTAPRAVKATPVTTPNGESEKYLFFKSAGLRLFSLLPREWTDRHLPLELSVPAKVSRVMVGRIELVTPDHRHLLREIAEAPIPTRPWAGFGSDEITLDNSSAASLCKRHRRLKQFHRDAASAKWRRDEETGD